jgi:hypothetical protein
MIVVEAGHAHVMKFLPLSHVNCQFLSLSVSFLGEKYGDEYFTIIFFNYRLNPKILSCFSPHLTPECERCVLT